ncbi:oxygen-insensitive NAD(P)H nitroreductase [Sphingorhabdus sp. 109]|uniref:oxygen-insensitive NAD(P)H nitroreductase n=1 Tax=Sphingorhabdus sp. 109 TaxID=2653173 RepID=UPI0012F1692B|nr:oxygen-insensitive NAD(P)H nitroreductase [Sphingorhabdus sp. 109]VWX56642.1 dihydropteridine reductase, NAD(P)H-dependent, oxygen-insensitive [Sphingorhabdus sp. 109]
MTLTSTPPASSSDTFDSISQDENIIPANGDRNPDGLNGVHDITFYAKHRHTVKVFDPDRKITPENVDKIRDLLRFSPSSTNAQPWKFILASTEEGKNRVAKATDTHYPFNSPSIRNASHVVVFASRLAIDEDFLFKVLDQEEKDGRFEADPETFRAQMHGGRSMFVNLHKQDMKDVQHWMDKQVYLNIGQFLLGVATLGIDATPMEGIETRTLDEEFGLREQGYNSLVVVALGYSDEEADYNAKLPKSRLPLSEILTEV